jgi:hypothetical protein
MHAIKTGVLDFALVFAAGPVLGTVRTLWVVPRIVTRMAELLETPIMRAVTILAAQWAVLRLAGPPMPSFRLGDGGASHSYPCSSRNRLRALDSRTLDQKLSC